MMIDDIEGKENIEKLGGSLKINYLERGRVMFAIR
jgi:hypothetical protein